MKSKYRARWAGGMGGRQNLSPLPWDMAVNAAGEVMGPQSDYLLGYRES